MTSLIDRLIHTIYEDNSLAVEQWLHCPGLDINQQGKWGYNSLHAAVMFLSEDRAVRFVELLLGHPNINVNSISTAGKTALWYAASSNSVQVTKLLLTRPELNVHHRCHARHLYNDDRCNDSLYPATTALEVAEQFQHTHVVALLTLPAYWHPRRTLPYWPLALQTQFGLAWQLTWGVPPLWSLLPLELVTLMLVHLPLT